MSDNNSYFIFWYLHIYKLWEKVQLITSSCHFSFLVKTVDYLLDIRLPYCRHIGHWPASMPRILLHFPKPASTTVQNYPTSVAMFTMTTRWQTSPWIYIDRVQDLRPPALNWDVCTTDDGVHLDQAGILQGNNEVVAQRQKPLQLHDQIHTCTQIIISRCSSKQMSYL